MNGKELSSVLVKMATSPVKADREAISRLERECQMDITKITVSLEDSEIIVQAMNSQPKLLKVSAMGFFWGAVIGIAMLFFRPNGIAPCGFGWGFVAGASGSILWSKD